MYGIVLTAPKNKEDTRTGWLDKTFKDKDGRVNIVAMPNIPLATWIVARLLAIVLHGSLRKAALVVAFIALIVWAIMEIYSGVNYFRRALGVLVFVSMVASAIMAGTIF